LRGGRSSQENREQKLEGKMEGRKKGRKEGHPDRWDKQMASRDGQTRWAYGRNQMEGKDEDGMDEFFLFSSFFILLPYFSFTLLFDSDRNSPHSLSVTPFTFTYFILSFLSNLPCHFTPWLVREEEGVTGKDTLTDTSATPYLVSLFTFIDLQTFTLLPSPQYQYLAITQ
jgi:hypothetical protein